MTADASTVVAGVERDLAEIAKRGPHLADSALAESARALAREMDNSKNSATSKSMCAKALMDTLDRLRELAPEKRQNDRVDELGRQREARRGSAAAN